MRNLIHGIIVILLCFQSCKSQQEFEKVDLSDVDHQKREFAQSLSHKLLTAQKGGGYYKLSVEEATTSMILGLHEDLQKDSYSHVKDLFGEYRNIEFDHMMRSTDGEYLEIYRFRGQFEKRDMQVEVRAVLDAGGKLAGFFIRPWNDAL